MGKKNFIAFCVFVYLITVAFCLKDVADASVSGGQLTSLCLKSSLPSIELISADDNLESAVETEETEETAQNAETDVEDKPAQSEIKTVSKKDKANKGKPKVLIYHTHATESYLPSSEGNYHRIKEENTVRDAGNILTETLEEEGIGVVHDKTLHDNPSYNNSYARSFDTVKALMKKYPSITCIIDLHRDATPAEVSGPVKKVKGKNTAVYSYVISNTTETYGANNSFLNKLNKTAMRDFDGFTGDKLNRPYWYNQELSTKAVLIEMGNNRNNIREVRNCARIFGRILAQTLKGD